MEGSQVIYENGCPKLYIDGKQVPPIIFHLSDMPGSGANTHYAYRNIRNFAGQGVHLTGIDTELRLGWHRLSPFEWEPLQAEIASAMDADPDTHVLIRLHVNPPYWWLRDHPEDTVIYDDAPGIDNGETMRLIRDDHHKQLRASIASEKWLKEAGECLAEFCRHICDTPEGKVVFAINVAYGINGEWHQWGNDCSEPMKKRFRRFLREKYGDDSGLQQAWGDAAVTIESAPFRPNPSQPGDDGIFRDPVKSRAVMDAQECIQIVVPEAILYLSRIVKENWSRPILTGAFYGYYFYTGRETKPIGGHQLPQILYKNREYVDFLAGPCPYVQNRRPLCIPMQRGLLESNRIRSVLWLTEMDEQPVDTENYVGGDPKRLDETISQLRRNTLIPLLAGQGFWYYDHRCDEQDHVTGNPFCASIFRKTGWWDSPVLLEEIRKIQTLAEKYCMQGYKPAADVLLVNDTDTQFALSGFVDEEYETQEAVCRAGVAFDNIYLNDLEYADLERYRVIVFINAYSLTAYKREVIRKACEGKQVVWLYAPGYANERTLALSNMEEMVDIHVKKTMPQAFYRVTDTGEEISVKPHDYSPFFAIEDEEAEPLAVYPNGEIAAAHKWNNWYFAVPRLDITSMKKVIAAAGAHVYCTSGEPVLAGNGLVALNCMYGGDRVIALKNGKEIHCTLSEFTTAIFDAETGARLD